MNPKAQTEAQAADRPALAGVRVLDLAGEIAGPYAARVLADWGAEVLKVEPPEGDPARRYGPFPQDRPHREQSGLFLYLNFNKRGITLNYRVAEGKRILRQLICTHDLVIAGEAPPVDLPAGAVWCAVTPWGLTGRRASWKGNDLTGYASGGLMSLTGEYDREPLKHGGFQALYLAGGHLAVAALVALAWRERTGEGVLVDGSVQEAVASSMQGKLSFYSYTGAIARRDPKQGGVLRSGIMPVADGYIGSVLVAGASTDWDSYAAFVNTLAEAPELFDPKYETPELRTIHMAELEAILRRAFAQHSKHTWFHSAQEWRLPFGIVQTAADLDRCPQLASRDFWVEIDHPVAPRLRYPGVPFHSTRPSFRLRRPAPLLGQHNADVYVGELGFARGALRRLGQAGVI